MLTNRFKATTRPTGRTVSFQLDRAPDIASLTDCLFQVMEAQSPLVELYWHLDTKNGNRVLTVSAPLGDGEAQWRFYSCSNNSSELLWEYASCDALLIHNMIHSTCGQKNVQFMVMV